jgi:spore maturation protein CgeB
MTLPLKLVVLGLSLSSSWGNGHATTYRALLKRLRRARPRDPVPGARRPLVRGPSRPEPDFCRLAFYDDLADLECWRSDEIEPRPMR